MLCKLKTAALRTPVCMQLMSSEVPGVNFVTCPSGFSLLSCGIENFQYSHAEAWRRSIPKDNTTCECYDYYGATCKAWCSTAVRGFQLISTDYLSGSTEVLCPSQKKVNVSFLSISVNE